MTRKSRHRIQKKSFTNLMFQTKLMREESFLTDVKLQCQDKEFLVHKVILSAASPYFKEQFKENSEITSLQMDFLNSKILETVLKFIYEGHIDLRNPSQLFLKDLIEASVILKIPLMDNHCLEQLLGTYLPEQLLSKWNTIEQLNSDLLKQIYLESLCRNIRTLKTTEGFLNLSFMQLKCLLSFCVQKPINHEEIMSSILLWVKCNQVERENSVTELLKLVDFNNLSHSHLVKFLEEPLLEDNFYFEQQLGKIFRHQLKIRKLPKVSNVILSQEKKELETKSKKKTLFSKKTKKSMHFDSETENTMKCERNNSQEKRKQNDSAKEVPSTHKEKRILCYDYLVFNGILEYNDNSKTWLKVNEERLIRSFSRGYGSAVCSFDNYICFLGGENSKGEITNQCYCLDLKRNAFFEIPAMREKRWFAKAVKLHDFIYVIGGSSDKNDTECCWVNERYNLITQLWERIPEIAYPYCVSNPGLIAVGDRLCLVGMVHLIWFDPAANEWKSGQRLPFMYNLSTKAVVYANGKILILDWGNNYIFTLDLKTNSWVTCTIPGNELYFRDIVNLTEMENSEFLVVCYEKSFLFSQPDSFKLVSQIPFQFPKLIVIGK